MQHNEEVIVRIPAYTGENLLDVAENPHVGRRVLVSAVLHGFYLEDLDEDDSAFVAALFEALDEEGT